MSYIILVLTVMAMLIGYYEFGFGVTALFCIAVIGSFLAFLFDDEFWEG